MRPTNSPSDPYETRPKCASEEVSSKAGGTECSPQAFFSHQRNHWPRGLSCSDTVPAWGRGDGGPHVAVPLTLPRSAFQSPWSRGASALSPVLGLSQSCFICRYLLVGLSRELKSGTTNVTILMDNIVLKREAIFPGPLIINLQKPHLLLSQNNSGSMQAAFLNAHGLILSTVCHVLFLHLTVKRSLP